MDQDRAADGQARATRVQQNGVRRTTPEPSRQSSEQAHQVGQALRLLCNAKRIEFTPEQLLTWVTVLSCFPPSDVATAATRMALGSEPFPQLGDLVKAIQREQVKRAAVPNCDPEKIGSGLVAKVMRAMKIGGE